MAEQQPFSGPASPGSGELDEEDEVKTAIIANRFDIRRIIGGLFLLYGAILVVTGIVGTAAIKNKAAGINVDLWTGLGMLVFGVFMIVWALQRPVMPNPTARRGQDSGGLRRAPS